MHTVGGSRWVNLSFCFNFTFAFTVLADLPVITCVISLLLYALHRWFVSVGVWEMNSTAPRVLLEYSYSLLVCT